MNSPQLIHATLAFFALSMTILSVWVKRSPWIWGSFLIIAFALGYLAKLVEPIALAPIGALIVLHSFLKGDIKGLARFVLVIVTIGISLGLAMRLFPGFTGWEVIKKMRISSNAKPISLYLNFSKPFIGLFVLALGFPLVKNLREFGSVMKLSIPLTISGLTIMIALAVYSGLIKWDPKWPNITWFFLLQNLIFITIIEEAFWRGFVQNELFRGFGGKGFFANTCAVLMTALGFTALHYFWIQSIPFLGLVFIASIIYGSIFQYTKALEASILCHFAFNAIHFTLFTYPLIG